MCGAAHEDLRALTGAAEGLSRASLSLLALPFQRNGAKGTCQVSGALELDHLGLPFPNPPCPAVQPTRVPAALDGVIRQRESGALVSRRTSPSCWFRLQILLDQRLDPPRLHRVHQCLVILLCLIGIGDGEASHGPVKHIAFTEIATDGCSLS
jgi:hypothetical protein